MDSSAGDSVQQITSDDDFKTILDAGDPFVVKFYAEWCSPCKAISPLYDSTAKDFPDFKFLKVNVDDLEDLAEREGASVMPYFAIYVGGEQVKTYAGSQIEGLKKELEAAQLQIAEEQDDESETAKETS